MGEWISVEDRLPDDWDDQFLVVVWWLDNGHEEQYQTIMDKAEIEDQPGPARPVAP